MQHGFFFIKKGRTRPNQMINLKVNFIEWRVYKYTGVVVVLVELLLDSLIYNQCLHRTPIVTQTDPYPYCHPNRPVPLLSPKQTRTPIVIQTDPYPYCHPNRPVSLLSPKQTRTPIVIQTDPYPYCHSNRPVPLLSPKQTRWPQDFLFTTQSLFIGRMCIHVGYKVCCVFHENYRWCL
jgi:hypothetical protein